ncbi:MAG: hypothetical protein JWM64_2455 [Frankiales bacterium]|nr:hypothetical protein [Frankiales bacterium]
MSPEEQADRALDLARGALSAATEALATAHKAEATGVEGARLALAARDAAEQAVIFAEQVRGLLDT